MGDKIVCKTICIFSTDIKTLVCGFMSSVKTRNIAVLDTRSLASYLFCYFILNADLIWDVDCVM